MTSRADFQQNAADFLKMWQEQMTRQMSDPDTIRAMLAAMQSYGAKPHDANARHDAPAPDARDDAIRDLAASVQSLERELVELRKSLHAALKNAARAKPGHHVRTVGKRKPEPNRRKPAMVAKPKPAAKRKPVAKKPTKRK